VGLNGGNEDQVVVNKILFVLLVGVKSAVNPIPIEKPNTTEDKKRREFF
jgi:hypothetical protein